MGSNGCGNYPRFILPYSVIVCHQGQLGLFHTERARGRGRETGRQTDRQTDRQRQKHRQRDREKRTEQKKKLIEEEKKKNKQIFQLL